MRAAELPSLAGCASRADPHEGRGQRAGVSVARAQLLPGLAPTDQRECVGEEEPLGVTWEDSPGEGELPRPQGGASARAEPGNVGTKS